MSGGSLQQYLQQSTEASNLSQVGVKATHSLWGGHSLIPSARNHFVSHFLKNPAFTHILFVDSDIIFTPENVFRLLEASKTKPIVAATYPKKGEMLIPPSMLAMLI